MPATKANSRGGRGSRGGRRERRGRGAAPLQHPAAPAVTTPVVTTPVVTTPVVTTPVVTTPVKVPAASARCSRGRRGGADAGATTAGASIVQHQPMASGDMNLGTVDDMQECAPLETPLHPKRRRTLVFNDYEPGSWSSYLEPSLPAKHEPSTPIAPPQAQLTPPASSLPAKFEQPSPSFAPPPAQLTPPASSLPAKYEQPSPSFAPPASSLLAKYDQPSPSFAPPPASSPPAEYEQPSPSFTPRPASSLPAKYKQPSPSFTPRPASSLPAKYEQPSPSFAPPPASSSLPAEYEQLNDRFFGQPEEIACEETSSVLPAQVGRRGSTRHYTPKKDKIDNIVNNGSEDEAVSDGDEDQPSAVFPRVLRVYVEPEADTEEEALEAGFIPPPPPPPPQAAAEGMLENVVNGDMNGPISLFDFEWTVFPQVPVSPQLRREAFVGSHGPTIEPISDPYEIFVKIWDRPVMEEIARQTNLYAQQYAKYLLEQANLKPTSRIGQWKDTNVDELYVYFALVMAMGISVKSKLEHYWTATDSIFSTPGFPTHMPLRRFQLLSKCLHFTDNTTVSSHLSRSEAKISKIKPIVDHLNCKFQALYSLGQNIALDESLTLWKGWLDIKQYIPNKSATVGIKTYEVCDSRSGYLWRFEVHSGSESGSTEDIIYGSIPNLVLRLLQGLNNRGHTVWMDNFYNSPALARILKSQGFDCVGTLRTNRQFVPDQIANLKKSDMTVGQVCGYTSGDVDVMVWRDQNRVGMISTYHGAGVYQGKPTLIRDYNVCMGGVDKKDQMVSMYPLERKRTQVWYKKFFKRLLNVSILNAYIIQKHFAIKNTTTHRAFRMELVCNILQRHHERRQVASLLTGRAVPRFSAEVQAHFPTELPLLPGENSGRQRRQCVVCKSKRTKVVCKACNVALCFNLQPGSNCFKKYHT